MDNRLSGLSWKEPANLFDTTSTTKPTGIGSSIDGVVTDGAVVVFINLSSNNNQICTAAVGTAIAWTCNTSSLLNTLFVKSETAWV